MDKEDTDFARCWAKRYIREHRPHGLDASDVENMILRRLHYNKDKSERGQKAALALALNEAQNCGRRSLRALFPWQVRYAEPHLQAQAYHSLAHDMHNMRIRQMVRENDRRRVRLVLKMLSPGDRSVARDFMELLSWIKVAERRGMSEGTFRRYVLVGFVARFKEAWSKVS